MGDFGGKEIALTSKRIDADASAHLLEVTSKLWVLADVLFVPGERGNRRSNMQFEGDVTEI